MRALFVSRGLRLALLSVLFAALALALLSTIGGGGAPAIAAVVLALVALLSFLVVERAGRAAVATRLEALAVATGRIARGDLSTRTGLPHASDEIGRLARAFDEMAERLERQVRERESLQEALRQAQKLDALGRLAGGIAHDFNNLLTAILSYGRFLREDLSPDDPRQEDVAEILRAGERAAALTKQLLAFSRKQASSPEVVELNPLVAGTERLLRRLIGEQYELRVHAGSGIPPVRIDPNQLEQALVNLVVNARDATPGGGVIEVETGHALRQCDGGVVSEHAFLAVRDRGIGMGPEVRARLFEPLFTTKERGKGTGLGLATAFGSVRSAGGTIAVESEPGRGSTFCIWLPAVSESPEADVLAGLTPGPRGLGETLLVVEDDDAVRSLAARVLSGHGYRVLAARHAEEALEVARRTPGPMSLLVADVVMPGASGPELARLLEAERPELRVLFMSGHDGGAVPPGAPLLDKPFTPAQLVCRVREFLAA